MTSAGEQDTVLRAALRYAGHGWPVFPVMPDAKEPLPGSHGFWEATTDSAQIRKWWGRHADRNVGIATGRPGPDVLDVDQHGEAGNGFAAFNRLRHEGLVDSPRALVRTPSGGFHAYFQGSDQACGRLPAEHVDFKAAGGYVVAPPSRVGGRPYEVIHHQAGDAGIDWQAVTRLLDPPQARQRRPARPPGQPADVGRLAGWVARLQPGGRNGGLFWAASRAAEAGVLDADGVEQLVDAALRSGLRGGEPEARRTISSAQRGSRPGPAQREREAG
jgi:Bifunctional DNA primase/polymerase, N-terminal